MYAAPRLLPCCSTDDPLRHRACPVEGRPDGAGTAGMAGNLVVGGIIGMGVDAATGAMNSHVPNPLVVTLVELDEDE